jgi:hypothetical protein
MSDVIKFPGTSIKFEQFTEFDKKKQAKIAEIVEMNSKEHYLSPIVEGYIYCTARALDFGDYHGTLNKKAMWEHAVNKNSDYFNYDELMEENPDHHCKNYLTFRKAGIFINHNSQDPEAAIGLAFDSTMITDPYEDMHMVLLLGVDKIKSPNIARTLQTYPTHLGTSMGCSIKSSVCTVCGTEIKKDTDFCDCLKHHRGGRVRGIKVAELLKGISFYEQSFVQTPAAPMSYIIDAVSDLIPGRLLKVAMENESEETNTTMRIMGSIYNAIKEAKTNQEKKVLSNQLDSLIAKLEMKVA